jgi:eukaryotic-like serine/threonine-protein kinase
MIGRVLGHYKVVEKLGEGGMGIVYKAHDTHLDRFVALKVLPADKVSNSERKSRFVQEAKAPSPLHHPNIVVVHDIDTADGIDFIAMEYVDGRTVQEMLANGKPLPLREALGFAIQIADALARAHASGIVHRDLRPANIMLNKAGLVKLLDFGLAKLTDFASDGSATRTVADHLTSDGAVLGTAAYMSP